jgi:hypothetical protein
LGDDYTLSNNSHIGLDEKRAAVAKVLELVPLTGSVPSKPVPRPVPQGGDKKKAG